MIRQLIRSRYTKIVVKEGLFLQEHGLSPYAGDEFHQPPLFLLPFYPFQHQLKNPYFTHALFILVDFLIAWLLRCIAMSFRASPLFVPASVAKHRKEFVTRCREEEVKAIKQEMERKEAEEEAERKRKLQQDKKGDEGETPKEEDSQGQQAVGEAEVNKAKIEDTPPEPEQIQQGLRKRGTTDTSTPNTPNSKKKKKKKNKGKQTTATPTTDDSVVAVLSENSTLPDVIMAIYLLNPWTIATCLAESTIVFNSFFVLLALYGSLKGILHHLTSPLFLSLYLSLSLPRSLSLLPNTIVQEIMV